MQRVAFSPSSPTRVPPIVNAWQARRWYYTPKSRRAYSVRQVSPGDRRLLAEFMVELNATATERDRASLHDLTTMLFDRVIVGAESAAAFVALENAQGADRVVGVCAYAASGQEGAEFAIAVASSFREEQVGRTLLSTLVRHAKRAGVRRLAGEMSWSNRAMHALAMSTGFQVLPLQRDRNYRLLVVELK
jgi:RimJ/RimL family protein N-acetyltransferase